jgi:hypothetical protein
MEPGGRFYSEDGDAIARRTTGHESETGKKREPRGVRCAELPCRYHPSERTAIRSKPTPPSALLESIRDTKRDDLGSA